MPRVRFVVALCSVIAALAQTTAPRKPVARPATGATEASQDRQLEAAIRARFAESKIASNHFQVRVQGGVATLEGRTEVIQHKGTATRLAKTMGAKQVVNRIEVSEAARQKATANLTEGLRRAQVKRGDARSERR